MQMLINVLLGIALSFIFVNLCIVIKVALNNDDVIDVPVYIAYQVIFIIIGIIGGLIYHGW